MHGHIDFTLYLITDRKILSPGISISSAVEEALIGGVRCIQLREKDLFASELYNYALELRSITRKYDAKLIINDRADIALASEADGVHLTSQSPPVPVIRKILGTGKLVGVSTHYIDEAVKAQEEGADFVTFGPVFSTYSKLTYGTPVGINKLKEVCSQTKIPVFALGGIKLDCLPDVLNAGSAGVALISAIFGSTDIKTQAGRFIEKLQIGKIK